MHILNHRARSIMFAFNIGVLILTFYPKTLKSQDRSFGTLPMLNTDTLIVRSPGDLNNTAEYDTILKIYNKLVNARGDFRYPVPNLFLKDVEGRVASIDYNTNEITLEKKAYDVCKKYGEPAIAFLLGHELTHYYEKHAWRGGFARDNADLKLGKDLKTLMDQVANETEADYLGGFLAYTAGFGMFDKGDEIISDLYDAYNMGELVNGYPSKSDRIELGKRSAKKLESLVDAFDMANLLAATGKDKEAYGYYQYILNYFQSRELYNNLGTIAVKNAMTLFDKDSLRFRYVSELDVKFEGSKEVLVSVSKAINQALDQAILHFNSAISLDPNYAPAYLNKANAYALKKDFTKANYYLNEEALPIAKKDSVKNAKTLLDITVLQGIILALNGDEKKAKKKFTEAKSKGSKLAAINLSILNMEKTKVATIATGDVFADTIGSTSLKGFLKKPLFANKKVMKIKEDQTFFQYSPSDNKSRVFFNQDDTKKTRTAYLMTQAGYSGTTLNGIKLGDTDDEVENKYGKPMYEIETTQGQLQVYDSIIFFIENNRVMRWANYTTKKFI